MAHQYMIHVFCDECSVPHPTGIVIERDELLSPVQSVGDIYDGREVPPALVKMLGNTVICPNTGKPFTQRDNRHVFLVRQPPQPKGGA